MTEATVNEQGELAAVGNPEVAANKATLDRKVEDIRNHPDLSDEAKKHYLAEAYEEAMEKHDAPIAEDKAAEEQTIAKLEREVFEVPAPFAASAAEKIANRQSYRDASFRVLDTLEKVNIAERQRVLEEMMERASRTGDDLLELDCYYTAVERGYWNVSNAYRAKYPEAAKL